LGNNEYLVTIENYQDCGAIAPAQQLFLNYRSTACNINLTATLPQVSLTEVYPTCPGGVSPCNSGYGVYHVIYSDTITLTACNDWILSYTNCCRSPNIVNLSNPSSSSIYGYVTLDNVNMPCNNSVTVASNKYPQVCTNVAHTYYPSAYDIDGDSLAFSLVNVLTSNGLNAPYNMGYTASNPLGGGTIAIDPMTGNITYTATTAGSFVIGYEIREYRAGALIATSYHDVNLVAVNCSVNSNTEPTYTVTNIQGGYLDQNIFWVTDSTQLTFDIEVTDPNTTNTLTLTSDIDSIGGSVVTVGTNPLTGSFIWPRTFPETQEFRVLILDDHAPCMFRGLHQLGFAIKHAAPTTNTAAQLDSMFVLVAEDSIVQICPVPLNLTALVAPTTTTYGSLVFDTNTGCLAYQAGALSEINEAFWVYVENNNSGITDSFWLDITTTTCVWAGDTDTNKVVNHFDVLLIGLGFGQTGAVRPNADLNYDCEPALNFANSTPTTNINYKHSDTDGNGLVNSDDTTAIILNWGQIHLKSSSNHASSGIPFYVEYGMGLPGQQMSIPIILGDTAMTADSIYGVAFTINYDESLMDTSTAWVDFGTSWLGTINSDMIAVQKDFYHQGHIDVGVVRTDQTNRNGIGQIGTLHFTIKDDILKSPNQRLDLQISNVRMITNIETERTATTPMTDVLITIGTNLTEMEKKENIKVFPNPTKQLINIQAKTAIEQWSVYSMTGQLIKTTLTNQQHCQLNMQGFAAGMYLLEVQTKEGIDVRKIQLLR